MGKLSLGLGLGIGYVLGAQAGRARYEQIKQAAAGLMGRPEVQQALEQAKTAAPAPLQGAIGKLAGAGGQGSGAGGQGSGAGGQDSAVGPTGGAPSQPDGPGEPDGSLPDPLVPPARST
jgi:hypothetical protein